MKVVVSPEVSVIMPLRPPAPWLEECLNSIRTQTFTDYQLICVVDGSHKATEDRLRDEPKTSVLVNQSSRGAAAARQLALIRSSSPFIATIDSDDVWLPFHLSQQLRLLKTGSHVSIAAASASVIDEDSRQVGSVEVGVGSRRRRLITRNQILNSSAVFRREEALLVGGYNSQVRVCEDYDLWLRIALLGDVLISHDASVLYRTHLNQISRTQIDRDSRNSVLHNRIALAKQLRVPTSYAKAVHRLWELKLLIR